MTDKKANRIPADQLTAYERWELPTMQPGGNDVIRSHVSSAELPVKPLTASDLETIRLEAYEAGFAEGKEEGTKQGHKEGLEKGLQEGIEKGTQQGIQEGQVTGQQQKQAEIDDVNARLNGVLAQLLDPIKQHDDEVEEALLNLVLTVSRAVIMREISLNSHQIQRTVKDALASLPSPSSNVKIWVNSVDYDSVHSIAESIADDVQVIKSDDILPGGCKVETLHSQIDATVEKRFQKTVQQMLDRHASSVPIDEAPDLTDSMEDMTDFHRDVLEGSQYEDSETETQTAQPSTETLNPTQPFENTDETS
ncbi:flagellar assembly protein FliH [Alkalimarinus alittae]|uniref:Flagellar assembly protein FliH n=1 Tax=Alkalimarinus alittae TaxID=2961619 RepID=A0ABY6MYN7_9ALTE|nr:flagellar assembly protein FliH [Alkalimarinus alittae]UZE94961.1 flagellar assembly protein FliH [Alkalimarinus alittae]